MGRRRKNKGMEVSLFPFLSILACVIGSLTLIITVLAVVQTQNSGGLPEDEVERAKEFMALETKWEKEKADLQDKMEEVSEIADAIMGLRKEKDGLEKEIAYLKNTVALTEGQIAGVDDEASRKLQQRLENFIERLKALEEDKKEAEAAVAELKAELEERKNQKPIPAKVVVRGSGTGNAGQRQIFFFEASAGALIYHESKEKVQQFPSGTLASNEDFFKVLAQVKKTPRGQIVFLIRPDGNGTYRRARQEAFDREIPEGSLPLVGDGMIDLSFFGERFN